MNIYAAEEYARSESESFDDVEKQLDGTVFHVTRHEYWSAIQRSGSVLPNIKGEFATTFGSSKNSFFRNRGCVSVFDYRGEVDGDVLDFRRRCYPFQPASPFNEGVVVLVLSPILHANLLPWTRWQVEGAYGEMIVPRVEAGHLGPIPLSAIDRVLFLRRTEDTNSLAAMFRSARGVGPMD